MREIKFRAWDMDRKVMLGIQYVIFYDGDFYENYRDLEDGILIENIAVMQYTGLKDKNGVEIYEGDIVFDRWVNEYTPVFQNGIYMAYNPKNLMQNDPSTQFNIVWKDGCEVIGNIYENPELLSTKKD